MSSNIYSLYLLYNFVFFKLMTELTFSFCDMLMKKRQPFDGLSTVLIYRQLLPYFEKYFHRFQD